MAARVDDLVHDLHAHVAILLVGARAQLHLRLVALPHVVVARQGEVLVFVEVKARSSEAFGSPLEAVGATKRRRLERAAQVYLAQKKLHGVPVRFDLVGV